MNSSVYSADRATHLRVVIAALMASIGIVAFSLAAHVRSDDSYAAVIRAHPNQAAELPAGNASVPLPAELSARPI